MITTAHAVIGLTLAVAGCGSSSHGPTAIGARGGGAVRGPALVFLDWGERAVFEADCWAPDSAGCVNLRAKALVDGELASGAARFRITGTRVEECGASGDTAEVVTYEQVAGPEGAAPGIATFPADAQVDLIHHEPDGAAVAPWMPAALAARATADLVGGDRARTIAASEIVVTQVVDGNFAGGPPSDQLIMATVPLGASDGPGYVWSALVLVPDGQRAALSSLWVSDLETMAVRASYDLDGDGARTFIFTADYYEGSGTGAAVIVDGKLVVQQSVGCGA